MRWRNWSGLVEADPVEVFSPVDTAAVVAAVRRAGDAGHGVKMVGAGHSFTGIAAPEHTMLRPDRLSGVVAVDREAMTVTALAGTPLRTLNLELERLGLSLHNLGDIDEQTLAGAVSTGTHGTGGLPGPHQGASLAAQLVGLKLVAGTGEVLDVGPHTDPEVFALARVGLGALGILTTLTFAVEPLFLLEAHERPMSWSRATEAFDRLVADNDHVDAYWFPHTDAVLVKTNNRIDPGADGGTTAAPLPGWRRWLDDELLSNTVFEALNRVGARAPATVPRLNRIAAGSLSERRYRDVAHRVLTSPRRVVFREMEYAVPREAGLAALREVRRVIDASRWRISFPIEVRVTPADDLALSTAHGRDSFYLAFHTYHRSDPAEHTAYFTAMESIMRDHVGRPHWGKLHTRTAADLAPVYPRFEDFLALRDRLDPDRIFDNAYLRRVLGD